MKWTEEEEFQNCHITYQLLHLVRRLPRVEREGGVQRQAGLGQKDQGGLGAVSRYSCN